MTILIVEDDLGISELIKDIVEELGYEAANATSVDQALKWLGSNNPFLMILDYGLPDMNGKEFIFKLKDSNLNIPHFIVSTGQGDERIAVEMMKLGAKDYIIKDNNFLTLLPEVLKRVEREINNEKIRAEMEAALKKSEAYNRLLFNTSTVGLALCKFDGSLIDINPAYAKIIGRSVEETLKLTYWDITPKEYFETENEQLKKLSEFGSYGPYEKEYLHKDGHRVPVKLSGALIYQNDEKFIWSSVDDISDRRKAEDDLIQSEKRFRLIAENTADSIAVFDLELNYTYISPSVKRLLGYTPEELTLLGISSILTPNSLLKLHQTLADYMKIQEQFVNDPLKSILLTSEQIKKDGSLIWVESTVSLIRDNFGRPTNILALSRDISERLRIEEALKISEEKYRSFSEAVRDLIIVYDLQGNISYLNRTAQVFLGWSDEEIIGRNIFDFIANEDKEGTINRFKERSDGFSGSRNVEIQLIDKNGKRVPFESNTTSIIVDNKITNLISVARNITERKKAEKELIRAKEKAEESDRLKSAFLANMSHEIRTPMNGILGFAQLLKDPKLTGDEQQEFINIIENSGNRMLGIINDIIDISKIESGQMELSISESNINEKIEYIYNFFKPEVELKGLNLFRHTPLSDESATIKTDKEKVYAVLMNLVKNAIKYTDNGFIEFGYYAKESSLEFYVKDTGIGIPKDRQTAIFERFIQADITDKRALQGAGLGLAISKAYVEMLNGKIWVESDENKGAAFYFSIPYLNEFKENSSLKSNEILVEKSIKKLKALIVEDDKYSEIFLQISLRPYASNVLSATNGIDAVEIMKNNHDVDLILMDIKMPFMNGLDATKAIREFNKDVIIIAQTAFGLSGDREKALDCGCNDYLSKPIQKSKFKELIEKYFSN